MKAIFKIFILAIFAMHASYSYAQITTKIDEVYVNSQTSVSNCSTISFGTTNNNSLTFYFTITKTESFGDGYLKVKLKHDANSTGSERGFLYISSNMWNGNEFVSTIAVNISASEVEVSGSSVYLEFTKVSSPFNEFNSCNYPITKTPVPTFTLSPTTASIACGDMSSRTFTVTPANIPSGANVTYDWSHPGWDFVGSTANSYTLKPSSATALPSSVSVTPRINGIAKPYLS